MEAPTCDSGQPTKSATQSIMETYLVTQEPALLAGDATAHKEGLERVRTQLLGMAAQIAGEREVTDETIRRVVNDAIIVMELSREGLDPERFRRKWTWKHLVAVARAGLSGRIVDEDRKLAERDETRRRAAFESLVKAHYDTEFSRARAAAIYRGYPSGQADRVCHDVLSRTFAKVWEKSADPRWESYWNWALFRAAVENKAKTELMRLRRARNRFPEGSDAVDDEASDETGWETRTSNLPLEQPEGEQSCRKANEETQEALTVALNHLLPKLRGNQQMFAELLRDLPLEVAQGLPKVVELIAAKYGTTITVKSAKDARTVVLSRLRKLAEQQRTTEERI